jgi:hypothetical protein
MYRSVTYDLTEFSNGTTSTTSDLIYLVFFITSLADIDTNGIRIELREDGSNYFYTEFAKTELSVGWNYLSEQKINFTQNGSPSWDTITSLYLGAYLVGPGDAVWFQAVELRQQGDGESITITTQDYNFQLSYSQDEDIVLKAYKFILSDSSGTEITDTG